MILCKMNGFNFGSDLKLVHLINNILNIYACAIETPQNKDIPYTFSRTKKSPINENKQFGAKKKYKE